jgi:uncharacterized metal-binding protein
MCESNVSFTCDSCTTITNSLGSVEYPEGCLTMALDREELNKIIHIYTDSSIATPSPTAAEEFSESGSGTFRHANEIVQHARNLGAKKIGITSCAAFLKETRHLITYLKGQGFESYCVICKTGTVISIPEQQHKTKNDPLDSICNPALQAYILEREKTELNVIVGICDYHNPNFIRHSKAPVTYLIVNDRSDSLNLSGRTKHNRVQ